MTETMLERMARGMWLDDVGKEFAGTAEGFADWEYQRDIYLHRARVAAEAMREPTGDMTFRGMYRFADAYENSNPRGVGQYEISQVWHAMIDAALQEHPGTAHDDSQPASDDQHHHGSVE